jgi:hypothetical protein
MDTKPLERFATWARRELLNAVDAQATAVLAVGSVARSERAEVIKKLEAEIARHGRQQVVDKVAYTWFNRIIALRFMDARGYTDVAVVSPARGQTLGQPEILSDAKRGNLDTDVVTNTRTANAIIGLLDGTRRSTDAEGEAYALLLTEHCRYWHKSMPFMFEREGDYTELLVPANLLADGAILARAREVLTEDICDDVEVIGWLYQFYVSERKAEVFAGFTKNKKAGAEEIPAATQLFTPHWIVRYLVENSLGRLWMLNRPASRLVDKMDYYLAPVDEETNFLKIGRPEELTVIDPACGSGHMLTFAFDLLYAIYEEDGYSPSEIPGLILTYNLHGTEIDPRAGSLAAFALVMKARAKLRTFFTKNVAPNICVLEPIVFAPDELNFLVTSGGDRQEEETFWNRFVQADTLGALIRPNASVAPRLAKYLGTLEEHGDFLNADIIASANRVIFQGECLSSKYAVVVANPPYMGSKQMGPPLRAFVEKDYSEAKNDLATAFMEVGLCLRRGGGFVAMVCPQSWMFLSRYEAFRIGVTRSAPPVGLAHLGAHAFPELAGEVVQVAAFVLGNASENTRAVVGTYVRLVDLPDSSAKERVLRAVASGAAQNRRFDRTLEHVGAIPGSPIAYWASDQILDAFNEGRPVGDIAPTRKGMVTARNDEFLRLWFEVSAGRSSLGAANSREQAKTSGKRWFGYIKGGPARRWYGNHSHVVDWEDDGYRLQTERHPTENRVWATNFNLDFIFRPNISWGDISGAGLTARWSDGGLLFDGKGPACFPLDDRSMEILALLNSHVAAEVMNLLNPTLNFLVGDVARIPLVSVDGPAVTALARQAVEIARSDWDSHEMSWNFHGSPLIEADEMGRLSDITRRHRASRANDADRLTKIEDELGQIFGEAYGILPSGSDDSRVKTIESESDRDLVTDLVSYFVGCAFGRYGLEEGGLILADQGGTLQDYLAKVSSPAFQPDADNVIPFVDDGWFEDDIVDRFREFLRVAFGEERFGENLRFVEESLGVRTLRDYFITKAGKSKFYDDHVQRYKKRPIYWMFSSPKGSFNALIYMHRYTLSTVSTVLNEYLREYRAKLEVALVNAEQAAAGGSSANDLKEADRLRKVLVELAEYERDVLYPLATQQIAIDLDDGVKANYPKFYPALKKIAGLEAEE